MTNIQRESSALAANGFAEPTIYSRAPSDENSIPQSGGEVNPETGISQTAEQGNERKVLHASHTSLQSAATKVLEESKEKYGTGLTMSANDGILNEKDVYAIDQYKKSGVAYPLNAALRSGMPLTDAQREIVRDIDQALLKLPTYQGTVYRSITSSMIEDFEEFKKKYVPDSIVIESAFTSSSADGVYDETMDIQMIIQSKHGRDMRAYNPLEQEVLFKRGSMFIVDKVEGNRIWLTEV